MSAEGGDGSPPHTVPEAGPSLTSSTSSSHSPPPPPGDTHLEKTSSGTSEPQEAKKPKKLSASAPSGETQMPKTLSTSGSSSPSSSAAAASASQPEEKKTELEKKTSNPSPSPEVEKKLSVPSSSSSSPTPEVEKKLSVPHSPSPAPAAEKKNSLDIPRSPSEEKKPLSISPSPAEAQKTPAGVKTRGALASPSFLGALASSDSPSSDSDPSGFSPTSSSPPSTTSSTIKTPTWNGPDWKEGSEIYDESYGVGFSGGGLRSAAFCSGVLWVLMNQHKLNPEPSQPNRINIPRGRMPKFYSGVSGGGFIAASFTWWNRLKGGVHPSQWQDDYFSKLRAGIGSYFDLTHPARTLLDVAQILVHFGFLILTGLISFVPVTYIFTEFIDMPYSAYYNILYFHVGDVKRTFPTSFGDMDASVFLSTDIAWLVFLIIFSGIPFFAFASVFLHQAAWGDLKDVFLEDTNTYRLRCTKLLAEMFSGLTWFVWNIFEVFLFTILCDFTPLATAYDTSIAITLRIVILYILFRQRPGSVVCFLQSQILIWAYYHPHRFFGVIDDDFSLHYYYFAVGCKILLPFVPLFSHVRETQLAEFARHRLTRALFRTPETVPKKGCKGLSDDSPRRLFWQPPSLSSGQYPTYLANTTVNGWMMTPQPTELFPLEDLTREQEAKFYFTSMPPSLRPRVERILQNGEDRQEAEQLESAASFVDDSAPSFYRELGERERYDMITFERQSRLAHTGNEEALKQDLKLKYNLSDDQVQQFTAWTKVHMAESAVSKRRLMVPHVGGSNFIGKANAAFIDSAIKLAKEAMMADSDLRWRLEKFESGKRHMVHALRRSLRDLAWRNVDNPASSAADDLLTLSSEGWWERYEMGLNEPIYILPHPRNKGEADSAKRMDVLVGANRNVTLSEAMGLSAAAGSWSNAETIQMNVSNELQLLLGFHNGRWVPSFSIHWVWQALLLFFVELIIVGPVLIWGGLDDPFSRTHMDVDGGNSDENYQLYAGGASSLFLLCAWSFVLPFFRSWRIYPFLPHSRVTATLSGNTAWTHDVPSMLYLSDGGQTENLGLLPLLARRLKYIVIACGAEDRLCTSLVDALDQARLKLGVSFRELNDDQRRRRVKRVSNDLLDLKSDIEFFAQDNLSSFMVIEVLYPGALRSWKKSAGGFAPKFTAAPEEQQKGYIFFLRPLSSHPDGFVGDVPRWTEPLGANCIKSLPPGYSSLAGCCFDSCHRFRWLNHISGRFPYHSSKFQFLTPMMFDAYHVQGARCMKDAYNVVLKEEGANRRHTLLSCD